MIEMPSQTFDVQDFIDRQRLRPVHFGILALCFLVMFVDGFDIYMVGKIAPAIAGDFGAAPSAITPVIVMQQIGLAIGAFLMSPLGDRLGRKRMLLIAFAAFGLLTVATAFSPSIIVLAALRGITGLFLAAVLPYAVALISEFTPLRQRAMFLSAGMAGYSLGNVAGSMTALLVPDYGWEAGFVIGGAMPLATWAGKRNPRWRCSRYWLCACPNPSLFVQQRMPRTLPLRVPSAIFPRKRP